MKNNDIKMLGKPINYYEAYSNKVVTMTLLSGEISIHTVKDIRFENGFILFMYTDHTFVINSSLVKYFEVRKEDNEICKQTKDILY